MHPLQLLVDVCNWLLDSRVWCSFAGRFRSVEVEKDQDGRVGAPVSGEYAHDDRVCWMFSQEVNPIQYCGLRAFMRTSAWQAERQKVEWFAIDMTGENQNARRYAAFRSYGPRQESMWMRSKCGMVMLKTSVILPNPVVLVQFQVTNTLSPSLNSKAAPYLSRVTHLPTSTA